MGTYRRRKQADPPAPPRQNRGDSGQTNRQLLPAVDQLVQERPQRSPLAVSQVSAGGFLVFSDALAQRSQHSFATRRQRQGIASRVSVCVRSHHEAGLDRAANSLSLIHISEPTRL